MSLYIQWNGISGVRVDTSQPEMKYFGGTGAVGTGAVSVEVQYG